jgi:chaperonin GroES
MSTTLHPTGDRIIAIRDAAETRTASGLYIPESVKEKPIIATVVSTGTDVVSIEAGDKIVYKEFAATELEHEGTDYIILNEDDVLALIDDQETSEEE